jgi:uncharacterized protein
MDGDRSSRYQPGAPCPVCSKPATEVRYRPFCCGRCADIDLGRWLGEKYRVATEERPDQEATTNTDAEYEK